MFLFSLLVFLLAIVYSIWLPNRIIFGNVRLYGKVFDLDQREFYVLILFFFLSIYLGFFPNDILSVLLAYVPVGNY